MSMYTDPNHLRVQDPGQVEGNPVFIYLDAFCTDAHFEKYLPEYKNLDELKAHYMRGGLGDVKVKKFLNNVIQMSFAPSVSAEKSLQRIFRCIQDLEEGSIKAEKKAAETLAEMKRA